MKASSTYFKRASENEYKAQKEDLKRETVLKTILSKKNQNRCSSINDVSIAAQKTRLRTNSFDYGYQNMPSTTHRQTELTELLSAREHLLGALSSRSRGGDQLQSGALSDRLNTTRSRKSHSPLIASLHRPSLSARVHDLTQGVGKLDTDRMEPPLSSRMQYSEAVETKPQKQYFPRGDYVFENRLTDSDEEKDGEKSIHVLDDYRRELNPTTNDVPRFFKDLQNKPVVEEGTNQPVKFEKHKIRLDLTKITEDQPKEVKIKKAMDGDEVKEMEEAKEIEHPPTSNRMAMFHSFQVERKDIENLLQNIEEEIKQDMKPKLQLKQEEEGVKVAEKSVVQCLVCFDKVPDAVFMECGHGGKLIHQFRD